MGSIQQVTHGVTTGAAAPTAVAPTWAASRVGSTLVVILTLGLNAAPTITLPAGWALVSSSVNGTAVATYVYTYANNPGALTGASWTVGGGVQSGAWVALELTGVGANAVHAATLAQAATTALSASAPAAHDLSNLIEIGAFGYVSTGGAFTDTSLPGTVAWVSSVAAQTSTNSQAGAVNVTQAIDTLMQGANPQGSASPQGTVAVAAASVTGYLSFITDLSLEINRGAYGVVDVTQV